MTRRIAAWCLPIALVCAIRTPRAFAQEPTIPAGAPGAPGSTVSSLGATPGAGASPFGFAPGAGEMILGGRPGPSFPRVPASVTTPGLAAPGSVGPRGIAPPARLPVTVVPLYGPLALPNDKEEAGPPEGLTLDQAIERLVRDNLLLRAREMEIPLSKADVLTAGLRANPILFADTQLVPYGKYTRARNGGPTQYDVNVSHPIDLSGKRPARKFSAERAANVLEAQFQDIVRLQIDNLYTAYVDVLAARETVRFAETSLTGLKRVFEVTEFTYQRGNATRPDLDRIRIQRGGAEAGLAEARERLRHAKRTLATFLNVPADQAEAIELRGTIADLDSPPSAVEELTRLAIGQRPDLIAQRLGVGRAQADVRLAKAEKYSDVYVLYQPYTYQNNTPTGTKSPTSWAVGVTAALPVSNRNQGGILRARLNVTQTEVELAALERRVATEVVRAEREYAVSRAIVERMEREVLPAATQMRDDAFELFVKGEQDALAYFNTQRDYNGAIRLYRDALVRHRRSMLRLNTVVAQRVLP